MTGRHFREVRIISKPPDVLSVAYEGYVVSGCGVWAYMRDDTAQYISVHARTSRHGHFIGRVDVREVFSSSERRRVEGDSAQHHPQEISGRIDSAVGPTVFRGGRSTWCVPSAANSAGVLSLPTIEV